MQISIMIFWIILLKTAIWKRPNKMIKSGFQLDVLYCKNIYMNRRIRHFKWKMINFLIIFILNDYPGLSKLTKFKFYVFV